MCLLIFAACSYADIVKKPTITILGGYSAQNTSLAGSTSKPTVLGAQITLEMPATESLQYIVKGELDSEGGDYTSGGTASYSGSQYSFAAGVKFEL